MSFFQELFVIDTLHCFKTHNKAHKIHTCLDQKVSKELYRALSEEDRLELLRMFFAFQPSISLAYLKEIDHVILTKEDFVLPCKEYDLACDQSFFFFVEKNRSYCDGKRNCFV